MNTVSILYETEFHCYGKVTSFLFVSTDKIFMYF